MPRRKKPSFKITTEARRRARLGAGLPPPERVITEKQFKPPKHKKRFVDVTEDN